MPVYSCYPWPIFLARDKVSSIGETRIMLLLIVEAITIELCGGGMENGTGYFYLFAGSRLNIDGRGKFFLRDTEDAKKRF